MLTNEERERLVKTYETIWNAEKVAKIFDVSVRTVYRLVNQKRESGSVAVRTSLCGRKPSLTEEDISMIDSLIKEQPDITIREINEKLGRKVSDETVRQAVIKLGYRYKKKSIYASERRRLRCGGTANGVAGDHTGKGRQ